MSQPTAILPPALLPVIHAALEAAGEPSTIRSYHQLRGGFSSNSLKITARHSSYLLKWNEHAAPDTYADEACGLAALRQANVIRVPHVLAATRPTGAAPGCMLQEWIPTRAAGWPKTMNKQLGASVAALHRVGNAAPGYGQLRADQPPPADDWVTCYRDQYLRPAIERAARKQLLPQPWFERLERVLERLGEWLGGVVRQPALIHGDLWRNNVLCDTRGMPVLIDPHAAHADREYELMITEAYGGFSPTFFMAYEAAWPFAPGRAERRPLYRLHMLLQRLGAQFPSHPDEIAAIVHWYIGD